jgi:hypothetical protein
MTFDVDVPPDPASRQSASACAQRQRVRSVAVPATLLLRAAVRLEREARHLGQSYRTPPPDCTWDNLDALRQFNDYRTLAKELRRAARGAP